LRQKAPNVRLNVVLGPLEDILGAIGQGRADIAIGRFDRLPDRYMTSRLLQDDYVSVMRAGHPLAACPLTMDAYLQSEHLILHAGGAPSDAIDTALATKSFKRKVAMQFPHGLAAVIVLLRTDMIATVTRGAALLFKEHAALTLQELPFQVERSEFRLVWHPRLTQSPAHKWLRHSLSGIGLAIERELVH
jgi:DNA-binding transcriptional LysR family regulator